MQPILQATAAAFERARRARSAAGPRRTDALPVALLPIRSVLSGKAAVSATRPARRTFAAAGFAEGQAAVCAGVGEAGYQLAYAGMTAGCCSPGATRPLAI